MKAAMQGWFAVGFWLLSGCQDSSPLVVILPELEAHEIAFLVPFEEGVRLPALGPIPLVSTSAELRDDQTIYLFVFDTRTLSSLHRRVDPERWSELQIVDPPESCSACDSVCRSDDNNELFHSVGSIGRAFQLEEEAFVELAVNPLPTAWLRLPARWDCIDLVGDGHFEVVPEVVPGPAYFRMDLVAGERLLLVGDALRLLGAPPDQTLYPPAGWYFRGASGFMPDRAWVSIARVNSSTGAVWELSLAADRVEVVRETSMPFAVGEVYADEQGLVVMGRQGEIATSTDGISFTHSQIAQRPSVLAFARLGEASAPFLVGSGMGGVWRGNPWRPELEWSTERVRLVVDSSIAQFSRTWDREESILWARTAERGLFTRRGSHPWEPLQVDMPNDQPRCRLSTSACGFGEPPARTRPAGVDAEAVFTLADNCTTLMAFKLNDGCTSSVELPGAGAQMEYPYAAAVKGDFVYVILGRRLFRTPVALLH